MSEQHQYPVHLRIQMTGYDTVRYALLQADTSFDITATLSGFNAFLLGMQKNTPLLRVHINHNHNALPVSSLNQSLLHAIPGAVRVSSDTDTLRYSLAPRASRTYQPRINQLHLSFADQYGLYGQQQLTPDHVTLYGPEEILDQIDAIQVAPAQLHNIKNSTHLRLPLEPVWQQYADVHPSVTEVDLYLPVEAYVEKDYLVPIHVIGADTTVALKLYPDHATVRLWVPQCDLHRDPQLLVAVNYSDVLSHAGRLQPTLVSFSNHVRPRRLLPDIVQCVVIK